jgi:peptidoglycan hydrolase-like protein with peptidoglycan-binding domain
VPQPAFARTSGVPSRAAGLSFTPVAGVLQRKCDCGSGGSEAAGGCEECRKKKQGALQRSALAGVAPAHGHRFGEVGIGARLAVGAPGDRFEQEADRIADLVVSGGSGAAAPAPARVAGAAVQRDGGDAASSGRAAPAIVHEVLGSPGWPLDRGTRSFMEQRFGHDFGRVRVHTGARAAESARAVAARAYTVGNDVVFGAGAYAPSAPEGARLLAHELTHVLQQGSGVVRRACDPALVGARPQPVFFPKQAKLMEVFDGTDTLTKGAADREAVGLVQQALVDLCHPGGISGPNRDGVDRTFGDATVKAVKSFQRAEGLGATGAVDLTTFRCLDEARSRRVLPCKTDRALAPTDVRIDRELTGGRNEDLWFGRGDKTLDSSNGVKAALLAVKYRDQPLTLAGFQSEDEVADFGPGLARERIDAVDAELARAGHAKARTPHAQPAASGGIPDYPARRKVEVSAGAGQKTTSCTTVPKGWTLHDQGPCNASMEKIVIAAIDRGVKLMETALRLLTPGDPISEKAVEDRFGSKLHLPLIKSRLVTWKDHLDNFVRAHHTCTNECHGACENTRAYTTGTDETFLCTRFLNAPTQTRAQKDWQAVIMVHEAGHGALDTKDIAYDDTRLIALLHKNFAAAEINTDSYVLLIRCLSGVTFGGLGCSVPKPGDTFPGLGPPKSDQAGEALAWTERWMDFGWQGVNSLYAAIAQARKAGAWHPNHRFTRTLLPFVTEDFGLRRPEGHPPPTLREQTTVAALHDHYVKMKAVTKKNVGRAMSESATAAPEWIDRGPTHAVVVPPRFFGGMGPRDRVRFLAKLLVQAQPGISSAAVPAYVSLTEKIATTFFIDEPK